jgi:hypothetical protein
MYPVQAWVVEAGGAKNLGRAFLGVVLGVGLKRMRNGRCVLRRLVNVLVACRRRWHRHRLRLRRRRSGCCCCFGGRRMSCVGCVDGKASDTCAKNDGDGDDEGGGGEGHHHLSSPSLPSLPSRKTMGRKRKMAILRANAGVAGTGRASGCSAGG